MQARPHRCGEAKNASVKHRAFEQGGDFFSAEERFLFPNHGWVWVSDFRDRSFLPSTHRVKPRTKHRDYVASVVVYNHDCLC